MRSRSPWRKLADGRDAGWSRPLASRSGRSVGDDPAGDRCRAPRWVMHNVFLRRLGYRQPGREAERLAALGHFRTDHVAAQLRPMCSHPSGATWASRSSGTVAPCARNWRTVDRNRHRTCSTGGECSRGCPPRRSARISSRRSWWQSRRRALATPAPAKLAMPSRISMWLSTASIGAWRLDDVVRQWPVYSRLLLRRPPLSQS